MGAGVDVSAAVGGAGGGGASAEASWGGLDVRGKKEEAGMRRGFPARKAGCMMIHSL